MIYIDSEGQETKRQNGNRIRQLDFDYLLGNAYVCGAPVSLYRMEPCAPPASTIPRSRCRTSR